MIKFFRRIRKQLADDNKPLKYMRYAIGEIVLVVIGILIALSINNWNIKRINKQAEIIQVEQLLEDTKADSSFFKSRADNYKMSDSLNSNIFKLYDLQWQDSIQKLTRIQIDPFGSRMAYQSNVVNNNKDIYDGILNSEIKKGLRRYIAKYDYVRITIELSNRMNETNGVPLILKYSEQLKTIRLDSTMSGYLDLIKYEDVKPTLEFSALYQNNALIQVEEFNVLNHKFIMTLENFIKDNK